MSILNSDAINADRQPVICDYSVASNTLEVTFAGVAAGLGIPPFEFFRTIAQIPTKRILLRDIEQVWYHRGLPGISTTIRETADYLKHEIEGQQITRTVFVGNSMGGYARRLRDIPNVSLRSYPARNHNLVKHLRKIDQLRTILSQSLTIDQSSRAA